jgi:hypothetical protein
VQVRRLLKVRRNVIIMIAFPVAMKGISFVADELRHRRGDSRVADRLDQLHRVLRKISRFV